MKICGFEKFSMVDWNGKIVCTVFTSGCNFGCPFCHNRRLATSTAVFIPESEVFDYLTKRKGLVDGVCISGGEPTLQPDLADFCRRIKELGYLVKLDTNGLNPNAVKALCREGLVDYVAMDVKNSPAKYAITAGVKGLDFSKIQESIDFIKNSGVDHEFRTTLIKDFHDEQDVKIIAMLVDGANNYYLQHYVDSDECIMHGFGDVDKETALRYLSYFTTVKNASLRGY